MKWRYSALVGLALVLGAMPLAYAQEPTIPPVVIPLRGTVLAPSGQPQTGTVQLAIAIYAAADDPAPVWVEVQTVTLGDGGTYSINAGATQENGIPAELLTAGTNQWLGVTVGSGPEQPRMRLVTVPYALRAASADTLGGKTAAEFVATSDLVEGVRDALDSPELQTELKNAAKGSGTDPGIAATVGRMPKFTTVGGAVDDSAVTDSGGFIGVGTTAPNYLLHAHSAGSHSLFQITNTTTGSTAADGTWMGVLAGDPTFRIINQEAAPIELYTNATRRITVDAAGKMGIGVDAPNYPVQLHSPAGNSLFQLTNAATGLTPADGSYFGVLLGNSTFRIMNQENAAIAMFTNGQPRLLIGSNGFVGIGTQAPNYLTHLHATTGHALLQLTNATTGAAGSDGVYLGVLDGQTSLRVMNQEAGNIELFTSGANRVTVTAAGNVGIGTVAPTAQLHVTGNAVIDGNIAAKYQDIAEWVDSDAPIEPGSVVIVDPKRNNAVMPGSRAYDARVIGAVSPQPGLILGERGPNKVMVAQSGRVRVKVDTANGPIRIGDLLVTSARPGYAMRSRPVKVGDTYMHRPGTVLGKALEPLAKGTGDILVLLTLQ
jgi:hypothetical protein